jgi:hypothetical protein
MVWESLLFGLVVFGDAGKAVIGKIEGLPFPSN